MLNKNWQETQNMLTMFLFLNSKTQTWLSLQKQIWTQLCNGKMNRHRFKGKPSPKSWQKSSLKARTIPNVIKNWEEAWNMLTTVVCQNSKTETRLGRQKQTWVQLCSRKMNRTQQKENPQKRHSKKQAWNLDTPKCYKNCKETRNMLTMVIFQNSKTQM